MDAVAAPCSIKKVVKVTILSMFTPHYQMNLIVLIMVILFEFDATAACQSFENNQNMIYSSGNRYSTHITHCSFPSNENEVIEAVSIARDTNGTIRATGKSHSKSGVNMMEEHVGKNLFMINMSESMNNIIEINQNANTITFEAGVSVYQLLSTLESYNLTLKYWAGGPQTSNFVGNFITGTHGMGTYKNPSPVVATNILSLKMVIANGSVIEASDTVNKDIFDAARVSFGALGIITEITALTQPIFTGTAYSGSAWNINNIEMAKEIIENNVTYNLNHYDSSYHRYFILSQYLDVGFKHIMNDTNISSQSCVSTVSMDNNINYEIKTNS
eukprot:191905_1